MTMKVLSDSSSASAPVSPVANHFSLPQGLIGFKDYTRAELLYLPDHLPFLWLKMYRGTESVHFIVIEPAGLVPGYVPELFDADAEGLGVGVEQLGQVARDQARRLDDDEVHGLSAAVQLQPQERQVIRQIEEFAAGVILEADEALRKVEMVGNRDGWRGGGGEIGQDFHGWAEVKGYLI